MFTNKKYENGDSLKKCFTKCLKIATSAMKDSDNLYLLVNILNKYIYFYMADMEQITAEDINNLIELIKDNIKQQQDKNYTNTYTMNSKNHNSSSPSNQKKEDGKVERSNKGIRFFENTMSAMKLRLKDSQEKFSKINLE